MKVQITGRGEGLVSPWIQCRADQWSVIAAAPFILTRREEDVWQFTAYVMLPESSSVFTIYPTSSPVRFSLLGLDVTSYPFASDAQNSSAQEPTS